MTPEQILDRVEQYETRLRKQGVQKQQMNPKRTFASASYTVLLGHALYLCDSVREHLRSPFKNKSENAHRHFSSLQMCLSFAGLYTLEELMDHTDSSKK